MTPSRTERKVTTNDPSLFRPPTPIVSTKSESSFLVITQFCEHPHTHSLPDFPGGPGREKVTVLLPLTTRSITFSVVCEKRVPVHRSFSHHVFKSLSLSTCVNRSTSPFRCVSSTLNSNRILLLTRPTLPSPGLPTGCTWSRSIVPRTTPTTLGYNRSSTSSTLYVSNDVFPTLQSDLPFHPFRTFSVFVLPFLGPTLHVRTCERLVPSRCRQFRPGRSLSGEGDDLGMNKTYFPLLLTILRLGSLVPSGRPRIIDLGEGFKE